MFEQRLARPGRGAFPVVVIRLVADEQDRQLAPADELLEKACHLASAGILPASRLLDGERNRQRADVAEVEIGRQTAGAVLSGWLRFAS